MALPYLDVEILADDAFDVLEAAFRGSRVQHRQSGDVLRRQHVFQGRDVLSDLQIRDHDKFPPPSKIIP